jgi:lincosamide and streptogramin A transport system ATP-binding/permease protein
MSTIQISSLTFSYDGSSDTLFQDVSFQIDTKWKLGFCGRNGRGKTTFLKLLMGAFEYRGHITSDVNFDYFPFDVQNPESDVLNILFEIAPASEEWQVRKELSLLSVNDGTLYQPFYTLSSGEQTKILLVGLFLKENNFLLIDEPTNHLDAFARRVVANYLKSKRGFILVSHDRAFLDTCCDHTLSINKTNIQVVKGNFSSWWEQKARLDAFEMTQNDKLGKEIKRMKESAKRTANWSDKVEASKSKKVSSRKNSDLGKLDKGYIGHQAAKMMKRSKSAEQRGQKALAEKEKLLKNIEKKEDLKIHPLAYHTSQLLSLKQVGVKYDQRHIFEGLDLTLAQGERLALVGSNGTGKSSILKLLCGELAPHLGTVQIGSGLIVSYVQQDATFLTGKLDDFAVNSGIDLTLFKTILRKLDFSREQFEKEMSSYSAGQKKKVLLAKSLSEKAHLYIWDEPLNYIDILSRIQIEALLLAHQPTMVFVEHDVTFIEQIATRTIHL